MAAKRCLGSQKWPTNYDGKRTKCPVCRQRFKLSANGRVPQHSVMRKRETLERIR